MSKIDWAAAKALYLTDETQSYQDVARLFNVSTRSVAIKAQRDNWQVARKSASSKVHQKLPEIAGKERTKVISEMIGLANQLQNLATKRLSILEKEIEDNPNAIEKLDLIEARRFLVSAAQITLATYKSEPEPLAERQQNNARSFADELNALPEEVRQHHILNILRENLRRMVVDYGEGKVDALVLEAKRQAKDKSIGKRFGTGY